MRYGFLLIDFFIIAAPVVLSFFIKMQFYRKWKYALIGIALAAILFILWDILFTRLSVWNYNKNHTLGVYLYNLPFEEVLFYLVIAYTCLYIYECLRVFFPDKGRPLAGQIFGWIIVILSSLALWKFHDQIFTSVTALFLLATYLNHLWVTRGDYLWHLMITWFIASIPMALIYGLLTGFKIIQFQSEYILGIKLGPIPFELFFHNLLYLTWMIWIYERYKQRPAWKLAEKREKETN
jgi:lycopene cyclase domain-containing protein